MSYVYFIQAGDGGPIKIGLTVNPSGRLNTLQTSNAEPLTLIGLIRGGVARERLIHHLLDAYRKTGEWFEPHNRVQQFIDKLVQSFGVKQTLTRLQPTESELDELRELARNFLIDMARHVSDPYLPAQEKDAEIGAWIEWPPRRIRQLREKRLTRRYLTIFLKKHEEWQRGLDLASLHRRLDELELKLPNTTELKRECGE